MRHPFPKSTKENGHQKASGDRGVYNRARRRSVFTQALLYSAATPTVRSRRRIGFYEQTQSSLAEVVKPQSDLFRRSVYEDKVFREGCK